MWMRCWFALLFSLLITLYCQYSHAEVSVEDVLGHEPGVEGVGRQGIGGGSGSVFSARGSCSIRCTGTRCVGKVNGSGGGFGGGGTGYIPAPAPLVPNSTGSTQSSTPSPSQTPTETFSENPSLVDAQAFATKNCVGCHTTEAKLNDQKQLRLVVKGKEHTFAQALEQVKNNPAMDKVEANANVIKALETRKNLP